MAGLAFVFEEDREMLEHQAFMERIYRAISKAFDCGIIDKRRSNDKEMARLA